MRVVKPDSSPRLQCKEDETAAQDDNDTKSAPWEVVEKLMKNPKKLETVIHENLETKDKERIKKDHIWAQVIDIQLTS